MSRNLSLSLLPRPVSINTSPASCSTSRHRSASGMRFRASAGIRRSHRGLGTTPNMAPPSRCWRPPSRAWQRRRPTWKVVWVMRRLRIADCGLGIRRPPFQSAIRNPQSAMASQVVSPQRQRHAPRAAAAAPQLAAVERDDPPLAVLERLFAGQQVHRRDDPEARVLHLPNGRFVARIGDGDTGAHAEEMARRRPLLALLQGPVVAAAEHGLEGLIHGLHRREEIGHLLHALGALTAVQPPQPPPAAGARRGGSTPRAPPPAGALTAHLLR